MESLQRDTALGVNISFLRIDLREIEENKEGRQIKKISVPGEETKKNPKKKGARKVGGQMEPGVRTDDAGLRRVGEKQESPVESG